MDIELTRTISLLEVLWVIVNLAGAYYSATNWWDARLTLQAALTPPVDRVAVILARTTGFVQASMMLVQTGYGLIGLLSWTTPLNPDTVSIGRTITICGFIILAAILALASYRVNMLRRQATSILEGVGYEGPE